MTDDEMKDAVAPPGSGKLRDPRPREFRTLIPSWAYDRFVDRFAAEGGWRGVVERSVEQ